jgi:acetylornithine deacetylase
MNPAMTPCPAPTTAQLADAVAALHDDMVHCLSGFVRAASPSGAEQPAADFFEAELLALGLDTERILLDSAAIADSPLFSCPCDPDGGRHNLLACHRPPDDGAPGTPRGRSLLFNGHLDVVPTGPAGLWQQDPYTPWVADGWLHGRGAGDMKGGLVCVLTALKALRALGLQPAGVVGINAVLDEENTGNGTLATVHALRSAIGRAKLADFDAVIIPEPFAETLMAAQVGVSWLQLTLTGKPAHVAYMQQGLNPIEAGIAILASLRELEALWNAPARRHPLFADHPHPINFNLGRISGGEWASSVPCTATLDLRVSYFPGVAPDDAVAEISALINARAKALNPALQVDISTRGHRSPGCVYPLDHPAMQALAAAHEQVNGTPPQRLACTATTDGRHFVLGTDLPATNYGPLARHIHGIDEAVSLASMQRVATTMARHIADWCGLRPLAR